MESEKLLTMLLLGCCWNIPEQIEVEISSWPLHLFDQVLFFDKKLSSTCLFRNPGIQGKQVCTIQQQLSDSDKEYNGVCLSF